MARQKDPNYVDGFHKDAIRKLLESPNTPKWVKEAWKTKLKKAGVKLDKLKEVA